MEAAQEFWVFVFGGFGSSARADFSPTLRIALATGFLGGFTTYSAFSVETLALFQRGDAALALVYAAVTLLGCLAACISAQALTRAVVG